MAKVYLDPGHGGNDPGAVANGLLEKEVVLKIAKYARDFLKSKYKNVSVKLSRTGDTYPSLSQRAKDANNWGADVFVSIHINAGGGEGYEDFIFNGSVSKDTPRLQDSIHNEVSKEFGTNRGQKRANFAVLRETGMPAVLTENGFIDNKEDAEYLKKDSNLKKLGEAHAKGIAVYLGLEKATSKPKSKPSKPKSSSPKVEWVGTKDKGKRVESIYRGSDGINFYDSPRWDNPSGTFGYGEGWIIDNLYRVDGSLQYRVKNSKGDLYYITARKDLVKVVDNKTKSSRKSTNSGKSFKTGDKVKIRSSATKYATGERIPNWVKGKSYTIHQVKSDRVLLREIYSWVRKSDIY